jgi:hypothetical protein
VSSIPATVRRFPWLVYWILFGLIALIGLLPFITMMVSIVLAGAYNCNINESIASVCEIGGRDMGTWIQAGMFSIFYFILSIPLAFVLLVVWLIVLLIHLARFNKRKAAA